MKQPTTKPGLSYVPYEAMLALAEAFEFGTVVRGHPKDDWRDSTDSRPWKDALMRHAAALILKGEKVDPESGIDHVAFILSNAAIILVLDDYKYQKPMAPVNDDCPEDF